MSELYLIPTPIYNDSNFKTLNTDIIFALKHFIVENIRTTRRFLKSINYPHPISEVWFYEVNEHNQEYITSECLQPIEMGNSIGLLSEAGIPCVADPGYSVVRLAHLLNITVTPLSGDSSILIALMSSGLQGQQFTFHGYLPIKPELLKRKLKQIEKHALQDYTQIFIETPYRNERLMNFIVQNCNKDLFLCVASNLLTNEQYIKTQTINTWSKLLPTLNNKPSVFLIGK